MPLRILLIEDDPIYGPMLKSDLEEVGHSVLIWNRSEGAVDLILAIEFNVIIIDIKLPMREGESAEEYPDAGIKILEELHDQDLPPVMFLSAHEYSIYRKRIEALRLAPFPGDVSPYVVKWKYRKEVFLHDIRRIEEEITFSKNSLHKFDFNTRTLDLHLDINYADSEFKLTLKNAVYTKCSLPITLAETDQLVNQIRRVLEEIVHLEDGTPKTFVYQSSVQIPMEVNQVALRRLADVGFRLYQRIFYSPAADRQTRSVGDNLRKMALENNLRIHITSDRFFIPWSLMYMDESYNPKHIFPEMFLGFKHVVEHIPLQQNTQVTNTIIDTHPEFIVGININIDIDDETCLNVVTNQLKYWNNIKLKNPNLKLIIRKTKQEVLNAISDPSTHDQVIYFYCHATNRQLAEGVRSNGPRIILSGGESLSLDDIDLYAPLNKPFTSKPLIFVNACDSAEMSSLFYRGWVPHFTAKGARGVIGTECEIPALFAFECAKRFFTYFLRGESVGHSILKMRREMLYEHNNALGLLYGLYCNADTRIVPALQITDTQIQ